VQAELAQHIASGVPADSARSVSQSQTGHASTAACQRLAAHTRAAEELVPVPAAAVALAADRLVAALAVGRALAVERAVAAHPARRPLHSGTAPGLPLLFPAKLLQFLSISLGNSS
jgi:hypothetical protein